MPAAHFSKNEGVELASRHGNEQAAQMLVQAQRSEAFEPDSRKRSTLADMRKDFEALQKQQPRWRWRAKVVLAFYTLARIAGSLPFTRNMLGPEYLCRKQPCYEEAVDVGNVCDAIFRPLVTGFGLYVFIHRMDRFSVNNSLHVWSLITLCCLALPLCDASEYICYGCCFAVVGVQCWALCRAASRAMLQARARGDEAVWWTACLLHANACMVPLGPALSFVGLFAFAQELPLPRTVVTVDVSFQVFNVIVLSGMVGSTPMNLETLQKLAELSGFGLACARVAFPGHISRGAADCVVSFPGKYSDLWDKAVSSVAQEDAFSLACVFLTDAASGLGRHANNPETPGKCWCQTIYGRVPASTYLSMVEISTDESGKHDQTLAFKRADAEAMGQRLLIKQHQGDIEWEQELAEALQDAEVRCIENQDRAPWGCQWFEEWKRNVDRAAELQQSLHVFYFQDSKGKGKMHWDLLANEKARHAARKDSGLGASQTAEVAYLDKIGLSYVEHDIMEFEAFLTSQT
ncbi:hypothetical protein AK812_SmicGene38950 [Symbiodinium microadriaticum]|uniref:Uncharacterized protein n=1 Tax=Symbiodinium microadriaticum TaxID=2951 RepID=A0A1Q9CCQ3_SYMMI|nr:hypothetical protein AK812_SmicGene38950 [Symbiodinium microadriaticum]